MIAAAAAAVAMVCAPYWATEHSRLYVTSLRLLASPCLSLCCSGPTSPPSTSPATPSSDSMEYYLPNSLLVHRSKFDVSHGGRTMGGGFERDEYRFLEELGLAGENVGCYGGGVWRANGPTVTSINPSDNKPIATVREASLEDYEESMAACAEARRMWMLTPAPKRGEIVRQNWGWATL